LWFLFSVYGNSGLGCGFYLVFMATVDSVVVILFSDCVELTVSVQKSIYYTAASKHCLESLFLNLHAATVYRG